MLSIRSLIIVVLLGLISTITCTKKYWVLCTGGLELYGPDHNYYLCKAFDTLQRNTYSKWKCPKKFDGDKHPSGTGCWTIPDQPGQQSRSVGTATCRDTYTFWTAPATKDHPQVVNGMKCRATNGVPVQCDTMDKPASIRQCDPVN
ncbi:secreted protein [Melampsora americana]|nr:secreted protein [Melampsora americana]